MLKWTDKIPKEPGWYWIRINKSEANIVRINKRTVHEKIYLTMSTIGEPYAIPIEWLTNKFKYEWAGPIEEPLDEMDK